MTDQGDIMTLREIAQYLKVSEKTVLRMARTGEMPAAKISGQWRFRRRMVDAWLTVKMQSAPEESLVDILRTKESGLVPIPSLIGPGRIVMNVPPGDKPSILKSLTHSLVQQKLLENPEDFLDAMIQRETVISTALGLGVAVPHTHNPEKGWVRETCMVLGICRDGTDFDSLDGKPTHLFLMPCARSVPEHLRLMAKAALFSRLPGLVDRLCETDDISGVMQILCDVHEEVSNRI